ncbi:MAG: hypothetical protein RSA01_01040 [Clostridium sp.]|uniref:hypothetical protein n=1 Tax=Clostridium sp. TaxID=1506 RepID=UPI002FC8427B
MKTILKPIDMVAVFISSKEPTPIKFRVKDGEDIIVVKIDRVISSSKEKIAGCNMYVYSCQSCIRGIERRFDLKYDIDNCKWILYKI